MNFIDSITSASSAYLAVGRSPEWDRIIALPRREPNWDRYEDLTPLFATPNGTMRLRPIQNAALWEAEAANGLFGAIAIGAGKTLLSLLLPLVLKSRCAVLLIPPQLRAQLALDRKRYGEHFRLGDPHVITYSALSSPTQADILDQLHPDLILSDEAHNLRHRSSTRTKRLLRYMRENPGTRFIALSGSPTVRSIRDAAHLYELALRKGSPIPNHFGELMEWADALDSIPNPRPPGVLLQLATARERRSLPPQEAARAGFARRVLRTPGVVSSGADEAACALEIEAWDMTVSKKVQQTLKTLRDTWTIDEEEFCEAIELAAKARQLALGFYYKWDWGPAGRDDEWLHARNMWFRTTRAWLKKSRPGLDSAALVAKAADRGELDPDSNRSYAEWRKISVRAMPTPEPVWLDRGIVDAAAAWSRDNAPAIVWYGHTAVGVALVQAGMIAFGESSAAALAREYGKRSIACSIKAHGTGKNLQAWSRALILSPPANGGSLQQLLGRLVRPGQQAAVVKFDVALYTTELRSAWDQAVADAQRTAMTEQTTQLVLCGSRP